MNAALMTTLWRCGWPRCSGPHGRAGMSAALLCAAVLLLGGCAHTGADKTIHRYELDAQTKGAVGDGQAQQATERVLEIAQISVPQWLSGTVMYYRLAYRDGNRLAAYAYSKWTAPPAALLGDIIRTTLAVRGNWRAVVAPGSASLAAVTLNLRLEQFSQVFSRPQRSAGIVAMRATLVDNPAERVIAQQRFSVQAPAPTADAQGGVQALSQASRQLAEQLLRWVQARADERSKTQHGDG